MGEAPRWTAIYTRLSYRDDGTEERCERQEDDCRRLADRLAWPVSEQHVFSDPARSAWQRNRKRPGWDRLLAAIRAGQIDAVIVYHGDRLLRQPRDLEDLLDIAREQGIRLASPSGTRNLDNSDDRFILRIEAAQACKASDDSSRRIRRARTAEAAQGLPRPGGTRAFGFARDNLTHEPGEVAIIREAVDRLLAGATMYGVTKWVNERCTTTTGRRWRVSVVKDMLMRPRMAGLIERDGQYLKAAWEPVIDPQVWEDLRVLLAANAQRYPSYAPPVGESAVRYLLSGIARCGTCGGTMNVQIGHAAGKRKRHTYLCGNSGCAYRNAISVPRLDAFVIGAVLELLGDQEFIAGLASGDGEDAAEIGALTTRRAEVEEQLRSLVDHPSLRPDLLLASLASFDRRIDEIRSAMAVSARRRVLLRYAGITREHWDGLALEVRRSIIVGLFGVRVDRSERPGPGFNPERIVLEPVRD